MDETESNQTINVRIIIEKPNKPTIETMRSYLADKEVIVESSDDRSIDIRGKTTAVEKILGVKIETSDQEANIVSGPDINIEAVKEPINAYIPRKPILLN